MKKNSFIKKDKVIYGSIFFYKEILREIILSAKIEKNPFSLKFIKKEFCLFIQENSHILKSVDYVIFPPSNPLSRLNGNVDLAYLLALEFVRIYNVKLIKPSFKSIWNFKKQSFKSKQERQEDRVFIDRYFYNNQQHISKKIVFIDDVITSGNTFLKRVEECSLEGEFLCLTFSDAGSF